MNLARLEQGFEESVGKIFEAVSDRKRPGRFEGGPAFPDPGVLQLLLRLRQTEILTVASFELLMRRTPRLIALSRYVFFRERPCGFGEEGQR